MAENRNDLDGVSSVKHSNAVGYVASALKNTAAGGVGGVCIVFVGHPFDTIKVRLQTQPKPNPGEAPLFKGTRDCAMKTVRNEGVKGLYRGMLSPLLVITPIYAICFFGYDLGKKLQQKSPSDELTLFHHFNAGMLAGLFISAVVAPGDRVKCLMQVQQSKAKYTDSIDCAKKVYHEGGIRSLYRGIVPTMLREIPGTGVYYLTYQYFLSSVSSGTNQQKLSPLSVMFAGGMAGVFYGTASIVQDTIKSRYQTAPIGKYAGIRDVIRDLYRNEGLAGFFKGFIPLQLRAIPGNAAAFLGYEASMRFLNWIFPAN